MLLSILLAIALALALWHLLRLFNFGRGMAGLFSGALFVISMAGTLGGLSPVTSALDQADVTIGTTRISDRKSVVSGKSGSVRVDLGGRRILKKKKTTR